jgi:hypothetical protein
MIETDIPLQKKQERKRKTVFTKEEDQIILDFVKQFGSTRWERIETLISTRTSRQCRERWKNFLSPNIIHKDWTTDEDLLLENLVSQQGRKSSKFVNYFPGRTDILIKNRYSLLMRHLKTGKRILTQVANPKQDTKTEPFFSIPISDQIAEESVEINTTFDFSFENFENENQIGNDEFFFFDVIF